MKILDNFNNEVIHLYRPLRCDSCLCPCCLQPFAMELPLRSPAKCELRSVIRFLNAKNNSPVEIHRQLVEVYGEKCMDIKNVRKWCREFNEGRINVHDEQRSGRPSLPESTVARINEMVRANRRITLEEIEDGLNEDCSHFSVHKIVSDTLGYRTVSTRWVDKWLKEAAGEWYNTGITKLVDRMKKKLEVTAPPGTTIGYVTQQWSILRPKFHIEDAAGQVVLQIEGPICTWSLFCKDVEFKVLSADGTNEVGRITKQWSGLAREAFTDADHFGISFPMDLNVNIKAVMLGACFLIDFMFFEKSQNAEHDAPGML
ncbi:hypothetical protein LAZ67_18000373 [Cordylochernes scorpioides]|uniref:Phospholipid scramblase n=1 Tax=Cordylochernes scorpioides TaxID=51811 RepID=A0ABY6LJQ0_9ARAC|nr:hypothetical protein LAZ67_18000373 [Cordylochernes scorpioides]